MPVNGGETALPGAGLSAKVLTVSDAAAAGWRQDRSGSALAERLTADGYTVCECRVVADGIDVVADALRTMAEGFDGLIATTGGTGFGPRDLTPEATESVAERRAPGLAEAMRAASPLGRLSRGAAVIVGRCLVLNTPGSPSGALETLEAVIDVLPHALRLLDGTDAGRHPAPVGPGDRGGEVLSSPRTPEG